VFKARIHRFVIRHCMGWCLAGVLLSVLQPFLFNHFRQDGWEDEPGFRLRGESTSAVFEPDSRATHGDEFETTLYAPLSAQIDHPDAFGDGLDTLLALVLLLMPLSVVRRQACIPCHRPPADRVAFPGGAPPSAHPWRRQPPRNAPPLTT
jgi:hypothetical protein